jgi:hypothetical protein
MAASRSAHCSPRAAAPSSRRNAGPGSVVLRAWARSTAANSTWLNLIGVCVGYQLQGEIIEASGEIWHTFPSGQGFTIAA